MRLLWIPAGSATDPPLSGCGSGDPSFTFVRATPSNAIEHLRVSDFDAVLLALPQPDWEELELIETLRRVAPGAPVIVQAPYVPASQAGRMVEAGAFQVVRTQETGGEVLEALQTAATKRGSRADTDAQWRKPIAGESRAIGRVMEIIRLVARRRCTVLIQGETGTGKEVIARAIHAASGRDPLVAVNCSALPESLLEAELFGHVRGAFTGALNQRAGRFEQANGGTLFLDEIGEMPVSLQAKLLRVLQEREFQRLGSSETLKVDIRVVAATNVDLPRRVREGKFREDLYYRLNVVPMRLPPLRERTEDIPVLVRHFLDRICREEDVSPKRISTETLLRLSRFDWPGNVRQLENAVEMAAALSGDRETLDFADFPVQEQVRPRPIRETAPFIAVPDHGLDFEQTVGNIERSILEQALRITGGNKTLAADLLQLKRTTLAAKLKILESPELAQAAAI